MSCHSAPIAQPLPRPARTAQSFPWLRVASITQWVCLAVGIRVLGVAGTLEPERQASQALAGAVVIVAAAFGLTLIARRRGLIEGQEAARG